MSASEIDLSLILWCKILEFKLGENSVPNLWNKKVG